jgi:hypothetical protein
MAVTQPFHFACDCAIVAADFELLQQLHKTGQML